MAGFIVSWGGGYPLNTPPFLPSVEILFLCSTIWTNLAYYLLSSCANFAYTRAKDNYANKETIKLSTLNYLFIFLISIYRDNRILLYRENQKTLEWTLLCFTFYFRNIVKDCCNWYISTYRVSQKTWEFSDEFNIVFVMN